LRRRPVTPDAATVDSEGGASRSTRRAPRPTGRAQAPGGIPRFRAVYFCHPPG